jgi:hypothetical protein
MNETARGRHVTPRLFPRKVRSTYCFRPVMASRAAWTRSCQYSSPRCRIESGISPRPHQCVWSDATYRKDGQKEGQRLRSSGSRSFYTSDLEFYWQS